MQLTQKEIEKMVKGRVNFELRAGNTYKHIATLEKSKLLNYGYNEEYNKKYEDFLVKHLINLGYIMFETTNRYMLLRETPISYARGIILDELTNSLGVVICDENDIRVNELQCLTVASHKRENPRFKEQGEEINYFVIDILSDIGFELIEEDKYTLYFKRKEER